MANPDSVESLERERKRIENNIVVRHGVIQDKSFNADFHIEVEGLPASKGKPIKLFVDDKELFNSGDTESDDVKASVTVPHTGKNNLSVRLEIGVMGFKAPFNVNKTEGCYFKLKGTDTGLEKLQQTKPF